MRRVVHPAGSRVALQGEQLPEQGVVCRYLDPAAETLPRVRVDFALQVHPPRGGEIPFEKILEFDPDTDLGSVFVAGTSTLP